MEFHRWLRLMAGIFVLASLALGYFVSPLWYFLIAFIGLNFLQSAFTRASDRNHRFSSRFALGFC